MPPTAPKAASAAPDRVQRAADNAEITTLKEEIKRLKDRLDALEAENDQNIDDYNALLETHNELEKLFGLVVEVVEATGLSVVNESEDRTEPKLIMDDPTKAAAWFEAAKAELEERRREWFWRAAATFADLPAHTPVSEVQAWYREKDEADKGAEPAPERPGGALS